MKIRVSIFTLFFVIFLPSFCYSEKSFPHSQLSQINLDFKFLKKEDSEFSYIIKIKDQNYLLVFDGCNETKCKKMIIGAKYKLENLNDEEVKQHIVKSINFWNSEVEFGKSYIEKDNSIWIEWNYLINRRLSKSEMIEILNQVYKENYIFKKEVLLF